MLAKSILRNVVVIVCRRHWRDAWQHEKTLLSLRYQHVANVRFQSNNPNKILTWTIFLVDVNLTNIVLLHDVLEGRVCVVDGRWRNNVGCLIMHQLDCGTWPWRLTVMARDNVEVRNWKPQRSLWLLRQQLRQLGCHPWHLQCPHLSLRLWHFPPLHPSFCQTAKPSLTG